MKTPITSLEEASSSHRIIDDSTTEYTFFLETKESFDKRIPSKILSELPGLDYQSSSYIKQAAIGFAASFVSVHSPKKLSFQLTLNNSNNTATLTFLNYKETIGVDVNFGFGSLGSIYVHQIKYRIPSSQEPDSKVYLQKETDNWDPGQSSADDGFSIPGVDKISLPISTQAISNIWKN